MNPTVSVLTPVYNASSFLPQLIRSVAMQRGVRGIEHVLIDDGSTDDSLAIMRDLAWDGLRFRSRGNRGQYRTHNDLWEMARGEFVLFIAADDYLASQHALSALVVSQQERDYDVVAGRVRIVDDRYGGVGFVQAPTPGLAQVLLPFASTMHHSALLVRRCLAREHDLWFRDEFGHSADWDWLLRLRDVVPPRKWGHSREVVAAKRVHEGQISRRQTGVMLSSRGRVMASRGIAPSVNDVVRATLDTANRAKLFWAHARERGLRAALGMVHAYLIDEHDRPAAR